MIVVDTNVLAYLWLPGPRTTSAEALLRAALGGQIDIAVESAGRGTLVDYLRRRPMRWT